jgi:hypothetical protein
VTRSALDAPDPGLLPSRPPSSAVLLALVGQDSHRRPSCVVCGRFIV